MDYVSRPESTVYFSRLGFLDHLGPGKLHDTLATASKKGWCNRDSPDRSRPRPPTRHLPAPEPLETLDSLNISKNQALGSPDGLKTEEPASPACEKEACALLVKGLRRF